MMKIIGRVFVREPPRGDFRSKAPNYLFSWTSFQSKIKHFEEVNSELRSKSLGPHDKNSLNNLALTMTVKRYAISIRIRTKEKFWLKFFF